MAHQLPRSARFAYAVNSPDLAPKKQTLSLLANRVRRNHERESPFFPRAAGRGPVSVRELDEKFDIHLGRDQSFANPPQESSIEGSNDSPRQRVFLLYNQ